MEQNATYLKILDLWDLTLTIGAIALFVAAVLVILYHRVRYSSFKEYKDKYDYLSKNDIRMQWTTVILFAIAIGFWINTTFRETIEIHYVWFLVRFFITFCISTLIIYVSYLLYKYSYPASLDKKLKVLRYKPRTSSAGNEMKLLSEEEEDVHLDEGMQAEEDVFSVDYDVWIDEETSEVKIEKYAGRLEANVCNSCGFYTMKLKSEEIVEPATHDHEGELVQHWQCSYCGVKRHKSMKIAKLAKGQEFTLPEKLTFKGEKTVSNVKVDLYLSDGTVQEFEFQNTEETSKFLTQYQNELDAENALYKG